jgi:uncharacterized membrane protein
MDIRFLEPTALLLLLFLPVFVWRWNRLKGLSTRRRWTALFLRLLVALLLILGLAQVEYRSATDLLSVLFVLDISESIPPEESQTARRIVRESVQSMGIDDRAGVVVFGRDAALDRPAEPYLAWESPNSLVDDEGTNLAAALRLGLAAFPVESQKRLVLFSDGNENSGAALEEARRLAGQGIPVDVFPLEYRNDSEVFVEKIVHPNAVNEDEPVSLDVFVTSRVATTARLRLLVEDRVLREEPVSLQEAKNKYTIRSLRLPSSQLSKVEVRVEAAADTNLENNRAVGYVNVVGKPKILLLDGDLLEDPDSGAEFVAQLESEGIQVARAVPGDFSENTASLLAYDAIVLSNVDAAEFTQDQMEAIEKGVKELGVGLVMVGGTHSFGAGGYRDTPIEQALPVSMDITERKILPTGALAIVLHTCEIPSGNDWMRKIAIEAIRVLDEKDEVGMLDYGWTPTGGGGVKWIFPLDYKGDGRRQIALIKQASPGDMPDFGTAMKLGYNSLRQARSNLRHMVVISDGDPQPPSGGLLTQFQRSGITCSTVLIGGHGMNFRPLMRDIASKTGGEFYDVRSPNALPRIFAREAARVKRNLIVEEAFNPNQVAETELTESFDSDAYPPLLGYVIATPKSQADLPLVTHQEDPLLAHWRYGLGKSIAFTSDFKTKWAPNWIEWEGYGAFWAQALRWVARTRMQGDYHLQVFQEEGKGRVVLEAFDEEGRPLNYLDFNGRAISPDQEVVPLRLVQTDLGRYEATFDVGQEGTYLVNLSQPETNPDEETGVLTAGLAIPYSPEHSNDRSNPLLLRQIAEITGGRYQPDTSALFERNLVAHAQPIPLWPYLLALALVLFWFDVFVRRVLLDWGDVRNGLLAVRMFLLPQKKERDRATLDRLKEVKSGSAARKAPPEDPGPIPEGKAPGAPKFDFEALEKRKAEDVSLERPEGRKAPPKKREAEAPQPETKDTSGGARTTKRLLDLKKKMDDK